MTSDLNTLQIDMTGPVAYITLNRPEVRNAMNRQMVLDLRAAFSRLHNNRDVRAIVLSGADGTFTAGGDLKEMQAAYADPGEKDRAQSEEFDLLLRAVNSAPQVVIARVEGAAMGGGLGLVCVSDIAVAADDSIFALPEVRLGIIPALIMPYVIQRIDLTNTRRLMLTGARIEGEEAAHFGLVHEVCSAEDLDTRLDIILADIRECGPEALAACKRLMFEIIDANIEATAVYRANLLDELRRSLEGQEGMLAFIQKRKPKWTHPNK
jgi:isohexenylglutaconyl-CoA hydratase